MFNMPWSPWQRRCSLALALQGGGAHGAFTWGVLDALLSHEDLPWNAASGTSAGAMNAVVLAHGLAAGGPKEARAALRRFWEAVGSRLPFEWLTVGNTEAPGLSPAARAALHWSQWWSPYDFNPLGMDPLRQIVESQIDFDRLRRASPIRLFIATTHASSGRMRLFREHELSADALLASACLPNLAHSVLIEGQAYWDGAWAANPPLWPLIHHAQATDVVLVLLAAPAHSDLPPRSADDIRHQMQNLAFVAPLMRELQWLAEWRQTASASSRWLGSARERRLRGLRLHLVDGRPLLSHLAGETRMIPLLAFLEHLHNLGVQAAENWWLSHGPSLGRRSSIDLEALLGDPPA